MITAKRKDGTPVQQGDRVLAIWDNGMKLFGCVIKLEQPMRFSSMQNIEMQVYSIKCADGRQRPAHARHIKFAATPKRRPT